jgi:carbon-monoxide dehydrogenase catalytic subunit
MKDIRKLYRVAGYLGVPVQGREINDIALDVAKIALGEFGKQTGELIYINRAPPKRQAIWRKLGVVPRGIDREVVETLHRTSIGVDQDAEHILDHSVRTALADGWGGSMIATAYPAVKAARLLPVEALRYDV